MNASTTASAANDAYGLLWWLRPQHAFAAVGIFGQAIYVNPPCRLVIVTHSAWPRATDRRFRRPPRGVFRRNGKVGGRPERRKLSGRSRDSLILASSRNARGAASYRER